MKTFERTVIILVAVVIVWLMVVAIFNTPHSPDDTQPPVKITPTVVPITPDYTGKGA